LAKPDEEIGQWLVATWVGHKAEEAGIPLDDIPREWAIALIKKTAEVDSENVENAALESVFRKACKGDYASAGRMLRGLMIDGVVRISSENLADEALRYRAKKHQGSKRGAASNKAKAEPWHAECQKAAKDLLASGREKRELAGILSRRFGKTPTQIRTVLRKAKDT